MGYLSTSPRNLGTGMNFSARVASMQPEQLDEQKIREFAERFHCIVRRKKDVFEVKSAATLEPNIS